MDSDRRDALNDVLVKAGLMLLGFAVVVAGGTWLMVHALGLNGSGDDGSTTDVNTQPYTPLPSTALPAPHDKKDHQGKKGTADKGDRGSGDKDRADHAKRAGHKRNGGFRLSATPVQVDPMQRINLTGTYRGHDNVQLQVQRLEHGTWADFPTQAVVQMGTFQTYVMTGHIGTNKFRVYDPNQEKASNIVEVQVG